MDLDDPARFATRDAADALGDVLGASEQWARAGRLVHEPLDLAGADALVVTGMGGSGIAGDVAATLGTPALTVPVLVNKAERLPAFVGTRTVVIAVSHSGSTWETLAAATEAADRGARLVVVTGGGSLGELADARGARRITTTTRTAPRHALGALAVPVLSLLGLAGDLDEAVAALAAAASRCAPGVPSCTNHAKQLGARLATGGPPVVWGARGLAELAALRLACQLNENAERPARSSQLPELSHNGIVGWAREGGGPLVVVRDPADESDGLARQVDAAVEVSAAGFDDLIQVVPTDHAAAPLARLADLLAVVDLASVYAALARDLDPGPVAAIDRLKAAIVQEEISP